jgi:hypothetical protein
MSNTLPKVPFIDGVKVRLAQFLMSLTRELGGDEAALAAALAKLNTTADLPDVFSAVTSAPLFRHALRAPDGSVVPVIGLRFAPQALPHKNEPHVGVFLVDVIVTDPNIGQQVLARVVVSEKELHLVAPGLSINDSDDSQADYHSGAMTQLTHLSEPIRAFIYHLLRAPAFKKGSAADTLRDEALTDLNYVNPLSYPLGGAVMDNLEAVFGAIDTAIGTQQGAGLKDAVRARLRTLPAGKFLTGKDIAAIIDPLRPHGLRLTVRTKDGEVAGLGVELLLTDDAGRGLMSVLIGLGLDGTASLFAPAFKLNVHGSTSAVDAAKLLAMRDGADGLSDARRDRNLGIVLSLVKAFGQFTSGDAATERLRRQIAQTLSAPAFDVITDPDGK